MIMERKSKDVKHIWSDAICMGFLGSGWNLISDFKIEIAARCIYSFPIETLQVFHIPLGEQ